MMGFYLKTITIISTNIYNRAVSIIYDTNYQNNYHRSGNFRCKNIFVVCANHENKKHEIYFTMDNHYTQNIFVRNFTA